MKWIFFDLGATLVDESDVYKSWCGRLCHAEFSSASALMLCHAELVAVGGFQLKLKPKSCLL